MADTFSYFDSVDSVKGIGDRKAARLEVLGIRSVGDLLEHIPYKYRDRRYPVLSSHAASDKPSMIEGFLSRVSARSSAGGKTMVECTFRDDSGSFGAVFFNMPYLRKTLVIGRKYTLFGLMRSRNGYKVMANPEIAETGSERDRRGIIPVYRCTVGITNNDFCKWIRTALDGLQNTDWIGDRLLEERNICSKSFAYHHIHFPESENGYKTARYRLIYEQLLIYQLAIRMNRRDTENDADASVRDVDISGFISSLKFELTEGQKKCISEIEADLIDRKPMNRLVQGDVGCGKTVIAEAAIYKCVKAGMQAVMMAPTEILAVQHFERIRSDMEKHGISSCILISGMSASEKKETLQMIADGTVDVIIGTHAVFQDSVRYHDLALVVTDEQHRFGVNQRKALVNKGRAVNVCVMSATPIPRTLAATVFGDMDFSIVRDKPSDRKKIITRAVDRDSRDRAYAAVRDELEKGHQAYVIAPSIDSEDDDMSSVEALHAEIKKKFAGCSVGLIHGKLDNDVKESVMNDFYRGKYDILVATVVIEVGIDVPNATIILLENSERYGLAQMHQLRGRVGRSEYQSYCYLINYSGSETSAARANAMVSMSDGFEISEEDYRLRGPGDIMGTMQSGNYQSNILSLCRYEEILNIAIEDADRIISDDSLADVKFVSRFIENMYAEDNSNII